VQLKCASPLEIQLYLAGRANETQPAGEVQTQVAVAMGAAGEELQRLRRERKRCGCGWLTEQTVKYGWIEWPWCGRQECLDSDKAIEATAKN